MHGIEKPIDVVFSVEGPEWHNLADVRDVIGQEEKDTVSFGISCWDGSIEHEGRHISFKEGGWKLVIGNFSHRADIPFENQMIPLFVPRQSYEVMENAEVISALEKAMEGIDYEITSMGTLFGGKRFFICVKLAESKELLLKNGEKLLPYLTFITSHDGSLALEAYDTIIRTVCNNTLEWSRQAAGSVGFKVYHTKGAATRMIGMAELINEILTGRDKFIKVMNELMDIPCTKTRAEDLVLGFFALQDVRKSRDNEENPKMDLLLSTRRKNMVAEIVRLAWAGRGNTGGTLWALLNGATEFWGDGDGTGKKGGKRDTGKKLYSAYFGRGMEYKRDFTAYLMNKEDMEKGVKLQAKYITSND